MVAFRDLAGQRFGRWTALRPCLGRNWECLCDCGTVSKVYGTNLTRGLSTQCNNCKKANDRKSPPRLRHGQSRRFRKTRLYVTWHNMWQRCIDPKATYFSYYGGRGIKVCERWRLFENFAFDMGEKPSGMSIDRIDPNGDYEPSNCKWVSRKEQLRNTRRTRLYKFGDQFLTIPELAEISGVARPNLWRRLVVRGWPLDRALQP